MDLSTLQHSVFLYALGTAILSSLLQAFILWFIYETINVFYKTATSGFKNKLSTLLMFTAFVWFIGTFISKIFFVEKEIGSVYLSIATAAPLQQTPINESTIQTILSNAAGVLPYLSISYIFLLVFLMIKLFTAYRYVYFIANKKLLVPPLSLQDFASKVAIKIKIAKNIRVWLSDHVDVPATIGFIKPVILIPVASVNNLSSDQLEAIILHELSHIKRNDYLINLFISVIETILFFNPFMLLLAKAVKRERENCCDDFVIQYRYDPHAYASALLSLEQSRRRNLQLSVAAVSGKKQLLMRIKRITNNKVAPHQFNYGQKLFALLVMTGIIFSIGWLSPHEKSKAGAIQETKNLKKDISITSVLQNKKTALGEGKNSQSGDSKFKTTQAKDQKATTATFKRDDQKSVIPEDNGMKSLEWNDFENNIQEFSENGFKNAKLFNVQAMKFAPFKTIPNFIFPKLNLNIDVAELNKNLALAYKEINAMDWNKIQANINESLSNINIEHLSEVQKKDLFEEKARYAELVRLQKKQSNHLKKLLPQPGNHFFLSDSSQIAGIAFTSEDDFPDQDKVYSRQAINRNHESVNYNYSYAPKATSISEFRGSRTRSSQKVFTVTGLNNNNIKVIVEHITKALNDDKGSFNFSSSSPDKKESKEKKQKIIIIKVNELP